MTADTRQAKGMVKQKKEFDNKSNNLDLCVKHQEWPGTGHSVWCSAGAVTMAFHATA